MRNSSLEALKSLSRLCKAHYYKQARSHMNVFVEADHETQRMKYSGAWVDYLVFLLSIHVSNKNKN